MEAQATAGSGRHHGKALQLVAMQVSDPPLISCGVQTSTTMGFRVIEPPQGGSSNMTNLRKVGLAVVTAVLSIGVVSISAPAHADTTWGCKTCLRAGE